METTEAAGFAYYRARRPMTQAAFLHDVWADMSPRVKARWIRRARRALRRG